jgi:hypothetical protein
MIPGNDDVVAGLDNGTIVRLSGTNGNILWKNPDALGSIFTVSNLKGGSIVAGSREAGLGHVYSLDINGAIKWTFPPTSTTSLTLLKVFTNVTQNGVPEVIAAFTDGRIHVLNGTTGQEISPWPFDNHGDNVKDLLCTQDYTNDGFPDIIFGTEYGNLTIINGFTKDIVKGPVNTGYVIGSIQYMYFHQNGVWYLNKTLAISVHTPLPSLNYYIYGVNATTLALMPKQFQVPNNAQAQNLVNIGNYTSFYTGDLIFSANNNVYNISGTEIIVPEFAQSLLLVILLIAVSFLILILRKLL